MTQTLIFHAIKSLVDEGKQPTLALLKSRVGERLPMPTFIAAINHYKRDPSVIEDLPQQAPKNKDVKKDFNTIEQAQQQLEQRCINLEKQTVDLAKQLSSALKRIEKLEQTCI